MKILIEVILQIPIEIIMYNKYLNYRIKQSIIIGKNIQGQKVIKEENLIQIVIHIKIHLILLIHHIHLILKEILIQNLILLIQKVLQIQQKKKIHIINIK